MPSGLKTRDGDSAGDFVPIGFATGPACPICAAIAAPSAWTASVSSRRPGADIGIVEHDLVPVGRPGPGDRAVRDRGHSDPARREPAVEFDELGRDDPLGGAALRTWRL